MSCTKIDPSLHQSRKPAWIKVRLPSSPVFFSTKALISDLRLHTVCEEAQCPNRWECWSQGTATFMIAGERCTRACGFCAVSTAKPFALEADEPHLEHLPRLVFQFNRRDIGRLRQMVDVINAELGEPVENLAPSAMTV